MKYLNFAVELFLMVCLGYLLSFAVNSNSTVSIKNDLGERVVSDGMARIALGAVTVPAILFVAYCTFADVLEDDLMQ